MGRRPELRGVSYNSAGSLAALNDHHIDIKDKIRIMMKTMMTIGVLGLADMSVIVDNHDVGDKVKKSGEDNNQGDDE